jgi:hypothetical protein
MAKGQARSTKKKQRRKAPRKLEISRFDERFASHIGASAHAG